MTVSGREGVRAVMRADYAMWDGEGGWRRVAEAWGISLSMANRVALTGYWPRDAMIRRRLQDVARSRGVRVGRERDLWSIPAGELRGMLEGRVVW